MSTRNENKQTKIEHIRALAKKEAFASRSNIDIIKDNNKFKLVESRKNTAKAVETVNYVGKDTSEDLLRDIEQPEVRAAKNKPKTKSKPNSSGNKVVRDIRDVPDEDRTSGISENIETDTEQGSTDN